MPNITDLYMLGGDNFDIEIIKIQKPEEFPQQPSETVDDSSKNNEDKE